MLDVSPLKLDDSHHITLFMIPIIPIKCQTQAPYRLYNSRISQSPTFVLPAFQSAV